MTKTNPFATLLPGKGAKHKAGHKPAPKKKFPMPPMKNTAAPPVPVQSAGMSMADPDAENA